MSKISYERINQQYVDRADNILDLLPNYVRNYFLTEESRMLPYTQYAYACAIRNFFDYMITNNPEIISYENVTLEMLNSLNSMDFNEYLHELRKTNDEAAESRTISAIKGLFQYLIDNKDVSNKDALAIKHPKLRKDNSIIYMDGDEMRAFLDNIETGEHLHGKQIKYHEKQCTRDIALLSLMLGTGIRVSECVYLDIKDVNLDKNELSVIGKGKKKRELYFSDTVKDYLRVYMNERKYMYTTENEEDKYALFISRSGTRLSTRSIQKLVKKYAVPAIVGTKKITPHKLRSSYGTALLEKTNDIATVSEILGHENTSTTSKFYASIKKERRMEVGKIDTLS